MTEITEPFVKYLLLPICAAVIGLLGWALIALAQKLTADGKGSKLANVTSQLMLFAESAVAEVEANLRPMAKEIAADGKITPEEAARLKRAAMDQVLALLSKRGLDELLKTLGIMVPAAQVLISGLVERAVLRLPSGPPVVVVANPSMPPAS